MFLIPSLTGRVRVCLLLKLLYFLFILQQKIYVVQRIHQTILLVTVDFECLAMACGKVGDGLIGYVHLYFCLRVSGYGVEQFLLEVLAYDVIELQSIALPTWLRNHLA